MGSGYKTFTAGAVLTASDVQNYLQDQSVMVFGGTAARSSAIGTANFEEGMLTYLTDVDKLQVYTGAAFADVYPPATSNQGLTLINTTSFSGVNSVSLPASTFTATYDNYRVVINIETSSSGTTSTLRMRASGSDNSSSNYAYTMHFLDTSATTYTQSNANTTTNWRIGFSDNGPDLAIIDISNPMKALRTGYQSVFNGRTTTHYTAERCAGQMTVTTAYDSLTYFQNGMTGTIRVYGYNQ